jgi:hypothetical protein
MTAHEIIVGIITGLAGTLIIGLLGLLINPIRNALLYKRIEHDLEYVDNSGSCEWDIQWEDLRLTIKVSDVHNNYLENVVFTRNEHEHSNLIPSFPVKKTFQPFFSPKPIFIKLVSILRTKPKAGTTRYIIYFVLRKRRWLI